MPKKSKRQANRSSTRAQASPAVQFAPTTPKATEFNPDYTPVIKDLRRIGFLAGSFLIVLFVLSFILN